jgi:hypothetical protein
MVHRESWRICHPSLSTTRCDHGRVGFGTRFLKSRSVTRKRYKTELKKAKPKPFRHGVLTRGPFEQIIIQRVIVVVTNIPDPRQQKRMPDKLDVEDCQRRRKSVRFLKITNFWRARFPRECNGAQKETRCLTI